jgi:hypothetical protein
MKRLILQVNIPMPKLNYAYNKTFRYVEDLYDLSITQAKKYAERTDSEYMQITDCSFLPDKHPMYQRLKFFELDQYDEILYIDCDAVILNGAPNIFELYKDHEFSAVIGTNWHSTSAYNQTQRQRFNKNYGASANFYPFCSGVLLIKKSFIQKCQPFWRNYIDSFDNGKNQDEGLLNRCVIDLGEHYNQMDPDWGAIWKKGKYVVHLAGHRKNDFNLEKFCKQNKL